MRRIIGIITGVAILALMVGASYLIINNPTPEEPPEGEHDYSQFDYKVITNMAEKTDYGDTNPDSIVEPNALTGNLPDKIIGDANKAKIIIYEYADYACSHCAEMNTVIKKMVDKYDGKVAVVYRGFLLKGYPNNIEAASAANAAAIQGYWEKYKNLVYSDQATWFYLTGDEVVPYFGELFVQASDGNGDLDKFYADMESESVAKKLAFDHAMGEKVDITGTPTFRINGEKISGADIETFVEDLVKNS